MLIIFLDSPFKYPAGEEHKADYGKDDGCRPQQMDESRLLHTTLRLVRGEKSRVLRLPGSGVQEARLPRLHGDPRKTYSPQRHTMCRPHPGRQRSELVSGHGLVLAGGGGDGGRESAGGGCR